MLIDFRGKGREGEGEGEKPQCERETSIHCLSYMPQRPNPQPWHVSDWESNS